METKDSYHTDIDTDEGNFKQKYNLEKKWTQFLQITHFCKKWGFSKFLCFVYLIFFFVYPHFCSLKFFFSEIVHPILCKKEKSPITNHHFYLCPYNNNYNVTIVSTDFIMNSIGSQRWCSIVIRYIFNAISYASMLNAYSLEHGLLQFASYIVNHIR